MTNVTGYYPYVVYTVFGGVVLLAMAPYVARWALLGTAMALIVGGMVWIGSNYNIVD